MCACVRACVRVCVHAHTFEYMRMQRRVCLCVHGCIHECTRGRGGREEGPVRARENEGG